MGAIDINVRPKKAQLYLNGEYIGTADNFDGFPRYLWLREGTHRLIVFHEGYQTLARRVHIRAGEIIDLGDRLEPGEATPPEQLLERVTAKEPSVASERAVVRGSGRPGVEDRSRSPRAGTSAEPPSSQPRPDRASWRQGSRRSAVVRDQRSRPASLVLEVSPSDAVVYLDGRLLGSGDELSRLHAPLLMDAGTHRLEVTRPGYVSFESEFDADPGEQVTLEARLEKQP